MSEIDELPTPSPESSGQGFQSSPPNGPVPPAPDAVQRVQGPSIGLIAVGSLGALAAVANLVMSLMGDAFPVFNDPMVSGLGSAPLALALAVLALGMYGFVIWAALQMRQLKNHVAALVASVLVMVPCSCCCIVGLPIGIWSLAVLLKPEVKAAFSS